MKAANTNNKINKNERFISPKICIAFKSITFVESLVTKVTKSV